MSEENVEIVQRLFDAWSEGRFYDSLSDLDPDLTYRIHPPFPDAATLVGVQAVGEFMAEFLRQFQPGSFALHPTRLRSTGDTVIADVTQHGAGRTSGVAETFGYFMVLRFRDQKVIRMEATLDEADALKAAGLSE